MSLTAPQRLRETFVSVPVDDSVQGQRLWAQTEDGLRLCVWHVPAQGESQGAVLLLHGLTDSPYSTRASGKK